MEFVTEIARENYNALRIAYDLSYPRTKGGQP